MPGRGTIGFAVLLGALVVPIWSSPLFPSQDGPSHVYNAWALLQMGDPASYQLRLFYDLNPALHPNLLGHVLLAALQLAGVPPFVGEKLLVTLCVVLLPVALWRLIRAVEPGREVYALAALPFAYHNLLHRGFYSFSLGLSLCLLTLAYWWPRRRGLSAPGLAGLYALLVLTYLAHFGAFGMALLGMGIGLAWDVLARRGVPLAARLRTCLEGAAVLIPAAVLGADYMLRSGIGDMAKYREMEKLVHIFFERMVLVTFTEWHLRVAPWLLAGLAAGLAWTAWDRFRRPRLAPADPLLLFGALLVPLFFLLPFWSNGGGWINERIYLFSMLLLWAGLAPPPRWLAAPLAVLLVGCAAAHAGRLAWEYRQIQPELRAVVAAADRVPPHSTLDAKVYRSEDTFGRRPEDLSPFVHLTAHYGMKRDVVLFDNYELNYPYFPIQRSDAPFRDPDYFLAWPVPDDEPLPANLVEGREVLHRADRAVLLRRLEPPPPAWRGPLEIDLGAAGLATGSASGWLRLRPEETGLRARMDPAAARGRDDRVFRLRLPDGRYRVEVGVPAVREGRLGVEVYTGEGLAARHDAAAGAGPTRFAFEVRARHGRADLVFHARDPDLWTRDRLGLWAARRLRVERVGAP